ncbi:MAG: hypothetical protein BWK76_04120 [Desulfobulbaceae bacterium A2]|nr:MAG: hypothetical protein BWK76_04120 [Desulfobulbaceae bacterium A2]
MKKATIIPFDDTLTLAVADVSLRKNLAMADAIIVATARTHNCETNEEHLHPHSRPCAHSLYCSS